MRTFKLLNVVKIVDTEAKARRLEMLGYEEVKEEAPIPEEEPEEEAEEVEVEPEPKKKAPARKTTKEG